MRTYLSVAALSLVACGSEVWQEQPDATPQDQPDPRCPDGSHIEVTLSAHSGMPNPGWSLSGEAGCHEVARLVEALVPSEEVLFDYDEWNSVGYASFRIHPEGIDDLSSSSHVWRDMALLHVAPDGDVRYALGATALYDALVGQAVARGHGSLFDNYLDD